MKPMYDVFAQDTLVGRSRLECGDPPMGVAFGEFIPEPGYAAIEHECKSNHQNQANLCLKVQTPSGETIPCIGVSIIDCSSEFEGSFAEVNLVGVEYDRYAQLFPDHVREYERRFKS